MIEEEGLLTTNDTIKASHSCVMAGNNNGVELWNLPREVIN